MGGNKTKSHNEKSLNLQQGNSYDNIIRSYIKIMEETHSLITNSFESQFLDPDSFEALCFLVVCYRIFDINEQIMEDCLVMCNFNEDIFLDTIQGFFHIHNEMIPETLYGVVKNISILLEKTWG